jgi:hypothetical protein
MVKIYIYIRTHNGIHLLSKVRFWKIINKLRLKHFATAIDIHKFACNQNCNEGILLNSSLLTDYS